ncbi:MAG: hypothetical protein AB9866_22605 [Syntrophobacteraceae bacterium]
MDRLESLERQIEELRAEIADMNRKIENLYSLTAGNHPVERLLRQQGFPVIAHGDRSQLLFPPNISADGMRSCYQLMRRYSFRLFLRDLIQTPEGEDSGQLTRYCSLKTVRDYLRTLAELGIVSTAAGGYRLLKKVPSFGPTLEWYVCEIFQREFLSPALFNVRLRNTVHGGDYDVISIIAGYLVYVEVKSSPPRGVEHQAVNAFLDRIRDLRPHLAILFVDTELRMRDKLVPLLSEGLEREGGIGSQWTVSRLVDEIFHVRHSVYLINSRRGIYSNLRICIRDFLLHDRGTAVR